MEENGNITSDMLDSTNIPFEALAWENPIAFPKLYFYKAKSYIKDQKARIVIERNSISVLCIETDLRNDPFDLQTFFNSTEIKNGLITDCAVLSNNISLIKLNFNDSASIEQRSLQKPIVDINLTLDFLIDQIYIVSFVDLSLVEELNNDDIFLIDETIVDNPNMITQNNIEQVPVNRLSLISLSNYNASRINNISVNKVKPILITDILTENDNSYIFSINTELILWSNMQFFTTVLSNTNLITKSTECDIFNNDVNSIQVKMPVKLSINNFNDNIQFDNEWIKNCLDWNIAKDFLEQNALEDILTIPEIPDVQQVFNNVKLKQIPIKNQITIVNHGTPGGNYLCTTSYPNTEPTKLLDVEAGLNPPYHIRVFQTDTSPLDGGDFYTSNTPWINFDTSSSSKIILTNADGIDITIDNNILTPNQPLYFDISCNGNPYPEVTGIPFLNVPYLANSVGGDLANVGTPNTAHMICKPTDPNLANIDINFESVNGITNLQFYIKISNHLYSRLTTTYKPTTDTKILVKLLQQMLKYTINYRLGFPDCTYDLQGNPTNDMAKLKQEFTIQGVNPLECISNIITNFKMLNPWVTDLPQWDYLLKSIAMLSQYIYSTYSLNTGTNVEEQVTLPYYFILATPAIKLDNGVYDYTSLQVKLKSKFFDFSNYNNSIFNGLIFKSFQPTLNSKWIVTNASLRINYPFLNASAIENQLPTNPQHYNIEQEDYQKFIFYFIFSIDISNVSHTNTVIFDYYMNSIFQANGNYPKIKSQFDDISCLSSDTFYSSDGTMSGDLPFTAEFNTTSSSDILESTDVTITVTTNNAGALPINAGDDTIVITPGV